ncbi:MAG: NAD(P)-dependent oxidoreductase, partial [Mucinivorans sp.]
NVLGMKAFLDQAIRVGAAVYINCSTSEVYSMESWNENGGLCEDDFITLATAEHSQRTSYATGKLMTEFFIKDAVDKGLVRGCSIRFANVYSDNELYPKHIIPHILTSLKKDGSVTLLENSKVNRRTFLHNIDSCSSILELIASPEALDGTIYNVATEEEITIIDLVKLIGAKMGIAEPKLEFEGYRKSDPERRVLNTSKIKERTKWKAKVTLDKGLDMCLEKISKR